MLRRLYPRLARLLVAPSSSITFQSAIVSVCLATWWLQLTSLMGTSLPVVLALMAALALGIALGVTPIRTMQNLSLPGVSLGALLNFTLAAWMVASPWLLGCIAWTIAQPGVISLASPAWNTVTLFALASVALGLPAFVAAQLATDAIGAFPNGQTPHPVQIPGAFVFLGAAIGLTAWGIGLAQIIGPYHCGILTAGLGLVVAVIRSYRATDADQPRSELPPSRREDPVSNLPRTLRRPFAMNLAIVCGAWLATMGRLVEQFMPGTVYLPCSEVIGLCLGIAAGLWLASRCRGIAGAFESATVWTVCGLAAWGIGVLAAYPLSITATLFQNSYISSPTLLLLARGVSAGLYVLPIGILLALCLAPAAGASPAIYRSEIGACLVAGLKGFAAVSAWAFSHFTLDQIAVGLAWWTVAGAAPYALAVRRELFAGWPQRILGGAAMAVVVIAPAWRHNFDPPRSAKLLFNSNAAYAYRTGFNSSLLMSLDEGRHISTVAGESGICTVWRYGGHQLQIRDNGIPLGVVSTDPDAFPKFVPETMQAALPLVLQEKAERLLLLGLGSSESLTTALSFPVPEVVCLEPNAGLVQTVREIVAADSGKDPFEDERVTLSVCDPALGLAATVGQFDAIVSSPGHLALARNQPCLTVEFYQRVARKLAAGGVFCQRLNFVDFGPRPLRTIVRTMQHAFRDILALEVAPGDFVLAATNDTQGLIRPGLTARIQLPHMRTLCAQSGIDSTVILNLGAFNQEGLVKFCGDSSRTPNSAGSSRLAFSLPREVIRWGPKVQEVQEALAPARGRLLAWVEEADSPVLVRRLAEVQGQFDLMTKYADQFWAYRASLRSQVKDKPRSKIQLAGATDEEKQLHPEDRRRLRYFQVLGQAVRYRKAADIERLARFATPYDPLISYFVHEEAAELYSRSAERDVVQELRHRLYATFFSSPQEFSLRNVVAALRLLREHPEAEPDSKIRWDDLNALLQALNLRWQERTGVRPTNVKEVIAEIDTTILAAEQTFQVLDRLTAEADLPESTWTDRRTVLEKTLIRPVKAYQRELLPYLHRRPSKAPVLDDEESIGEKEDRR